MRKYAATEGAVLVLLVFVGVAIAGVDLPTIVWVLFAVAVITGVIADVARARAARQ